MLKNLSKAAALTIAVLALFGCTVQKPEEKVKTITVSGTGNVLVQADLIDLHFGIITSEWNIPYCSDRNNTITNKVIESIKALGIGAEDISSFDYVISEDNSNSYAGKYTITNTISVLIRNKENLPKVIEAAIANGAHGLYDFTYLITDKSTALRQARTMAIQNAQDAANLLAGASGCRVDAVIDIKENSCDITTYTIPGYSGTFAGFKQIPSEEGNFSINSNVTVTYSLAK